MSYSPPCFPLLTPTLQPKHTFDELWFLMSLNRKRERERKGYQEDNKWSKTQALKPQNDKTQPKKYKNNHSKCANSPQNIINSQKSNKPIKQDYNPSHSPTLKQSPSQSLNQYDGSLISENEKSLQACTAIYYDAKNQMNQSQRTNQYQQIQNGQLSPQTPTLNEYKTQARNESLLDILNKNMTALAKEYLHQRHKQRHNSKNINNLEHKPSHMNARSKLNNNQQLLQSEKPFSLHQVYHSSLRGKKIPSHLAAAMRCQDRFNSFSTYDETNQTNQTVRGGRLQNNTNLLSSLNKRQKKIEQNNRLQQGNKLRRRSLHSQVENDKKYYQTLMSTVGIRGQATLLEEKPIEASKYYNSSHRSPNRFVKTQKKDESIPSQGESESIHMMLQFRQSALPFKRNDNSRNQYHTSRTQSNPSSLRLKDPLTGPTQRSITPDRQLIEEDNMAIQTEQRRTSHYDTTDCRINDMSSINPPFLLCLPSAMTPSSRTPKINFNLHHVIMKRKKEKLGKYHFELESTL